MNIDVQCEKNLRVGMYMNMIGWFTKDCKAALA